MVETIPTRLQAGELYISKRYRTSVHLCCCGCGLEVVAPLNPAKWQLTEYRDGSVSLFPSIGNWSFPCRSHYWIERSRVRWSHAMRSEEHTSELQSLMRISYAVFCLKKQKT